MMAAESVFDAVSAITFGPAQTFRNLTLIPVIADDPVHADYLTLDEALGAKALRIEETSEAGSVPELKCAERRRAWRCSSSTARNSSAPSRIAC